MVKGKKGAEMTIGTLVIIVLAIIVLVVLALGFGAGWSNLWGKITGYFSPVNVDSVKQSCQYACTTKSSYDYCDRTRDVITLKVDGKKDKDTYKGFTCKELEAETLSFEACNEIDCPAMVCVGTETPLACVDFKNQKALSKIVDEILSITSSKDYLSNLTKQAKVKEYERQIDQMIYKLYGLTEDEIKIVENFNNRE